MFSAKGFTLVEVLIAALIIMIGVAGYVRLQSYYIRSDAQTNQRSVAMQLAQDKLSDLRGFTSLRPVPGEFSFSDITDDVGGQLEAGEVEVTLTKDEQKLYTFNRNWEVTHQYFVDTNADGIADSWLNNGDPALPAVLPLWPAQKQVTVTVSWADPQGEQQSLSLQASIAPVTQASSYQAVSESDNARATPVVSHTAGLAPDVVAYELGNNNKVETSKPVPQTSAQEGNNQVSFETVQYTDSPGDETKLKREEFVTVGCLCQLAGTGSGKTPHITVLADKALGIKPGKEVIKTIGEPAPGNQPSLCGQCCRDHHDTADMVVNEQHYRAEEGTPHKHYESDGKGGFSMASALGDQYNEVCRFRRVDGLFQIYPDWQLLDIIAFDDQYLLDASNLEKYTDYTEALISRHIQGLAAPARPNDRNISVVPGGYQMIARGIYLDRMKTEHRQQVLEVILSGEKNWKALAPFYDINLTLLANWSVQSPDVATVTHQDIQSLVDPDNDYYGTYSRGRIEALQDGATKVIVRSYPFNSGITGVEAVSPKEAEAVKVDDSVEVKVSDTPL
ncbi:type IV pilus modification PilV family protein [Lacimicrobium alkaliphilum]|uniref:Type IV pilin n=1 Tax=Lacimicrobium alkaliphilum TaxID=1526571 RepID=A0ABQ1RD03_9ALTE|nr:prepilin-type N-terminal cleavage/methylation domain-containing protein [Lacimicrobium alkaliphilum]GGD66390.1 type IV pilin [Lacimicrobium alkaliphilum]